MNDIIKKNDVPTTSGLAKLGITAIGYSAAGIFIFVLNAISRNLIIGLVAGGIVTLFGLGSLKSKDPADKKAGIIITAAGVLTLLSKIPFIAPVSSTILGIGAVGLLALGIWNGIKFFLGFKKRSGN